MGFLDEIKNKMHLGGQQGYDQGYGQDDDYGYDDSYDDSYQATATAVLRARASTPKTSRATACLVRRAAVKLSRLPCIRAPASWSAMTPAMPRRITRLRARRTVLRAVIVWCL